MFEGWLADALVAALGRYLDVQKDKLRISLWSGQGVLENVELRPDALDYLQLPISIRTARVGKLKLQIPWGRWMVHGSLLTIELSDVEIGAVPREEAEWDEAAAAAREAAAKQAELAAAELAALSTRSGWGRGYLVEQLATYLLNSLQLSITNLHVWLAARAAAPGQQGFRVGFRVDRLATALESSTAGLQSAVYRLLQRASQAAQIQRDIRLQGCQVYLIPCDDPTAPTVAQQGQPGDSSGLEETDAHMIRPFGLAVRVSVHKGAGGTGEASVLEPAMRLQTLLALDPVSVQASAVQLLALYSLSNQAALWGKRQRYGRFRPMGWCSTPLPTTPDNAAWPRRAWPSVRHLRPSPSPVRTTNPNPGLSESAALPELVPCDVTGGVPGRETAILPSCTWADMWRYAGRAVLHDLRRDWACNGAPPPIAAKRSQRLALLQLRYVQLCKRRAMLSSLASADGLSGAAGAAWEEDGAFTGRTSISLPQHTGAAPLAAASRSAPPTPPVTSPPAAAGLLAEAELVLNVEQHGSDSSPITASASPVLARQGSRSAGDVEAQACKDGTATPSAASVDGDDGGVTAHTSAALDAIAAELERLEGQLEVAEVLRFRAVADQLLHELQREGQDSGGRTGAGVGWGAWALTGATSLLGWFNAGGQRSGGRRSDGPPALDRGSMRRLQQLLHRSRLQTPPAAASTPVKPDTSTSARSQSSPSAAVPAVAAPGPTDAPVNPAPVRLVFDAIVERISVSLLSRDGGPLAALLLDGVRVQGSVAGSVADADVQVTSAQVLEYVTSTGLAGRCMASCIGASTPGVAADGPAKPRPPAPPRHSISSYQPQGATMPRSSSDNLTRALRTANSHPCPPMLAMGSGSGDAGIGGAFPVWQPAASSSAAPVGSIATAAAAVAEATPGGDRGLPRAMSLDGLPRPAGLPSVLGSDGSPALHLTLKSSPAGAQAVPQGAQSALAPDASPEVSLVFRAAPLHVQPSSAALMAIADELPHAAATSESLDACLQRAMCALPTPGAQLDAKMRYLGGAPPKLQARLELQEVVVRLEAPDRHPMARATASGTYPPDSQRILSRLRAASAPGTAPSAAVEVRVVQISLSSSAAMPVIASGPMDGVPGTGLADLTPGQQAVLYHALRISVSAVSVLFRTGDGVSTSGNQDGLPLRPLLLIPLSGRAALGLNRLAYDTNLPAVAADVELDGLGGATLHTSVMAAFSRALSKALGSDQQHDVATGGPQATAEDSRTSASDTMKPLSPLVSLSLTPIGAENDAADDAAQRRLSANIVVVGLHALPAQSDVSGTSATPDVVVPHSQATPLHVVLAVALPPSSIRLIDDAAAVSAVEQASGHPSGESSGTPRPAGVTLSLGPVLARVVSHGPDVAVTVDVPDVTLQSRSMSAAQATASGAGLLQPWVCLARRISAARLRVSWQQQQEAAGGGVHIGAVTTTRFAVMTQGLQAAGYSDQPSSFIHASSGRPADPASRLVVEHTLLTHAACLGSSSDPSAIRHPPATSTWRVELHGLTLGVGLVPVVQKLLSGITTAGQEEAKGQEDSSPDHEHESAIEPRPPEIIFSLTLADVGILAVRPGRGMVAVDAWAAVQRLHLTLPLANPGGVATEYGERHGPQEGEDVEVAALQHLMLSAVEGPAGARLLPLLHVPHASLVRRDSDPIAAAPDVPRRTLLRLVVPTLHAALPEGVPVVLASLLLRIRQPRPAPVPPPAGDSPPPPQNHQQQARDWRLDASVGAVRCLCDATAPPGAGGIGGCAALQAAVIGVRLRVASSGGDAADGGAGPSTATADFAWQEASLSLVRLDAPRGRQAASSSSTADSPAGSLLLLPRSSMSAPGQEPHELSALLPALHGPSLAVLRLLRPSPSLPRAAAVALGDGTGPGRPRVLPQPVQGVPPTEDLLTAGSGLISDDVVAGHETLLRFFAQAAPGAEPLDPSTVGSPWQEGPFPDDGDPGPETPRLSATAPEMQRIPPDTPASAGAGERASRQASPPIGRGGGGAPRGARDILLPGVRRSDRFDAGVLGTSPHTASVLSLRPQSLVGSLEPRGDTLYCSFRAASGGGPLAGMQEVARLPATPASRVSEEELDELDFYSVSEGTEGEVAGLEEEALGSPACSAAAGGPTSQSRPAVWPWPNPSPLPQSQAPLPQSQAPLPATPALQLGAQEPGESEKDGDDDTAAAGKHVAAHVSSLTVVPIALLLCVGHVDHGQPGRVTNSGTSTGSLWALQGGRVSDALHTAPDVAAAPASVGCMVCLRVTRSSNGAGLGLPTVAINSGRLPVLASLSLWNFALAGLQRALGALQGCPPQAPLAPQPTSTPRTPSLPIASASLDVADLQLCLFVAPDMMSAVQPGTGPEPHDGDTPSAWQDPACEPGGVLLDLDDVYSDSGDTGDMGDHRAQSDGGQAGDVPNGDEDVSQTAGHAPPAAHLWATSSCVTARVVVRAELVADARTGGVQSAALTAPAVSIAAGQLALQYQGREAPAHLMPREGRATRESVEWVAEGSSSQVPPSYHCAWSTAPQTELVAHTSDLHAAWHPLAANHCLAVSHISVYLTVATLRAVAAFVAATGAAADAAAATVPVSAPGISTEARGASPPPSMPPAQPPAAGLPPLPPRRSSPAGLVPSDTGAALALDSISRRGQQAGLAGLQPLASPAVAGLRGGSDDGSLTARGAPSMGFLGGAVQQDASNPVPSPGTGSPAQAQSAMVQLPPGTYELMVAKLAVLLSSHAQPLPLPLFEAVVSPVRLAITSTQGGAAAPQGAPFVRPTSEAGAAAGPGRASHDAWEQQGDVRFLGHGRDKGVLQLGVWALAGVQLDTFNANKLGWEPVIDPWPFQVRYDLWQTVGGASRPGPGSGQACHAVQASSPQLLQLTVSPTAVVALGAAARLFDRATALLGPAVPGGEVGHRPAALPTIAGADAVPGADGPILPASHWLCNDLGCAVEFWISERPRAISPLLASPDWLPDDGQLHVVPPGTWAPIALRGQPSAALQGRHVLSSHAVLTRHWEGSIEGFADVASRAEHHGPWHPFPRVGELGATSAPRTDRAAALAAHAAATGLRSHALSAPSPEAPSVNASPAGKASRASVAHLGPAHPQALSFRIAGSSGGLGVFGPVLTGSTATTSFPLATSPSPAGPLGFTMAPGTPRLAALLEPSAPQRYHVHGIGAPQTAASGLFRLQCDVSAPQQGGRRLSLHTNVRVTNCLSVALALAGLEHAMPPLEAAGEGTDEGAEAADVAPLPFKPSDAPGRCKSFPNQAQGGESEPTSFATHDNGVLRLAPGQVAWLPAAVLLSRTAAGTVCMAALPGPSRRRATTPRAPPSHAHHAWSDPLDLRQLLLGAMEHSAAREEGPEGAAAAAHAGVNSVLIRCRLWSAPGARESASHQALHVLVVASLSPDGKVWEVSLQPPLVLLNQLPVPVHAALQPTRGMARELRQPIAPRQEGAVLLHDPAALQNVLLRPQGFTWSTPLDLAATQGPPGFGDWADNGSDSDADDDDTGADAGGSASAGPVRLRGYAAGRLVVEHRVLMSAPGANMATVALRMRAVLRPSGQMAITVASSLWVYNCTGLPIALRVEPAAGRGSGAGSGTSNGARGSGSGAVPGPSPELWVPPCVGVDGEPLAIVAPRASHSAAVHAMHVAAAAAAAAASASCAAAEAPAGTQQQPGHAASVTAATATSSGRAVPPTARTAHPAPSNSTMGGFSVVDSAAFAAASATPAQQARGARQGTGLGALALGTSSDDGALAGPPAASHSSVTASSVSVAAGVLPAAAGLPIKAYAHGDAMAAALAPRHGLIAHPTAPSRSSMRSYTSRSSFSAALGGLGGGAADAGSNPFWQPTVLPALCGDLDPLSMALQLRVMPQGGSGGPGGAGDGGALGVERPARVRPWSRPLRVTHTGSLDVLALPCPLPKEDAASGGVRDIAAGGYFVAVRLVRVRGARRCWALHILPRVVLHNALPFPLQLQQPGAGRVRTLVGVDERWAPLGPGLRRPVHWPDASAPLRLSLRISEPGWSWSGSVDVGTGLPGDLFVKVRHRNLQETLLVHVDVRPDASGVLFVALSPQPSAFSPYRVDNFTGQALHVQQSRCSAEDIIRPYSCLPYAWDEPSLPHGLAVALPGGQRLGVFPLDQVGATRVVALRPTAGSKQAKQYLAAVVAAGPTRVLQITDLDVHDVSASVAVGAGVPAAPKIDVPSAVPAWMQLTQQLPAQLAAQLLADWAPQPRAPTPMPSATGIRNAAGDLFASSVLHQTAPTAQMQRAAHRTPFGAVQGPTVLDGTAAAPPRPEEPDDVVAPANQAARGGSSARVLHAVAHYLEGVPRGTLHRLSQGMDVANRRLLQPALSVLHAHGRPSGSSSSHPQASITAPAGATAATDVLSSHTSTGQIVETAEVGLADSNIPVVDGCGATMRRGPPRRPLMGPSGRLLLLAVGVAAPGLGVSLVSERQEMAYLQLGALQLGVTVDGVQATAHVTLGQLRVDNCLADAVHPTALAAPVTYSLFGRPQPILAPGSAWAKEALSSETAWVGEAVPPRPVPPVEADTAAHHQLPATPPHTSPDATPSRAAGTGRERAGGRGAGPPGSAGKAMASGKGPGGAVRVDACVWLNRPGGVLCVNHVGVALGAFEVQLEEAHIRALASYALDLQRTFHTAAHVTAGHAPQSVSAPSAAAAAHVTHGPGIGVAPPLALALVPMASSPVVVVPAALDLSSAAQVGIARPMGGPSAHMPWEPRTQALTEAVAQRTKMYVEELFISRLRVALSFTPAPWRHLGVGARRAASALRGAAGAETAGGMRRRRSTATSSFERELSVRGETGGAKRDPILVESASRGAVGTVDVMEVVAGGAASGSGGASGAPAPASGSLVRLLLSLAHLEGAWLTLKPVQLRHPLVDPDGLIQLLGRHYMTAGLLQLALAVGSLDIFGDLTRLVQAWGLGVWHLLIMPAQGAMQGGLLHAGHGLARGLLGLMHNTTLATLNTALKYMRRTHTTLLALCPAEVGAALAAAAHAQGAPPGSLPLPLALPGTVAVGMDGARHAPAALSAGASDAGLASAGAAAAVGASAATSAMRGAVGRLEATRWVHAAAAGAPSPGPLRALPAGYGAILNNVNRELAALSVPGLLRQTPAVVLLPVVVVLKMVESVVDSFQEALLRTARPRRMRVPRYIDPLEPLQRYNWLESYCRLLQQHVAGGAYGGEQFAGGVALCGGRLGVLTSAHLLVVAPHHANEVWDAELLLALPVEGMVAAMAAGRELVVTLAAGPSSLTQRAVCGAAVLQHPGGDLPRRLAAALAAAALPGGPGEEAVVLDEVQGSHAQHRDLAAGGGVAFSTHPLLLQPSHRQAGPSPLSVGGAAARLQGDHAVVPPAPAAHSPSPAAALGDQTRSATLPQPSRGLAGVAALTRPTLAGTAVKGWLGVVRLVTLDEASAAGAETLLQGLVASHEAHRWAGGCAMVGFSV